MVLIATFHVRNSASPQTFYIIVVSNIYLLRNLFSEIIFARNLLRNNNRDLDIAFGPEQISTSAMHDIPYVLRPPQLCPYFR